MVRRDIRPMRKLILTGMCALFASAVLFGCSSGAKDVSVDEVADSLAQNVTYAEQLNELEPEAVERAFRVDPADISAVDAYLGSGATVDEVSVWEGTDDSAAERIEQTLKDRLESRKADYSDYMPDEVPKLENAILVRQGKYVVLCVTADAENAQKLIDEALGR